MASIFYQPQTQAFDNSGNPIAGAKLFFYETGTSTPKQTFQDVDLNTPHANPVVADAFGVFPAIWLDTATVLYRVSLMTSALVLVRTTDNVGDVLSVVPAVNEDRAILTQHSITGGGDLSADLVLNLVNDQGAPSAHHVYGTDALGVRGWIPSATGEGFDLRVSDRMDEDFKFIPSTAAANGWDIATSGAGASVTGAVEAGHPGIIVLRTGTTTSGYAGAIYSPDASIDLTSGYVPGGGEIVLDVVFKHKNAIPTTGNFAFTRLGIASDAVGVPNNGIYFTAGVNVSGNVVVVGVCRKANVSVSTVENDGFEVVQDQWYRGRWVINAAGTEVSFFVGTETVTSILIGTIATNIPTVAMNSFVQYDKNTGTTSLDLWVDCIVPRQIFTTPRWAE